MCTLYFYLFIHYSMLITKNSVSIHYCTDDLLYPFHPLHPPTPFSLVTTLFSVSRCFESFLFFVFNFYFSSISNFVFKDFFLMVSLSTLSISKYSPAFYNFNAFSLLFNLSFRTLTFNDDFEMRI